VSRGWSRPWSRLEVSTISCLDKGLRSLLEHLGFGSHLYRVGLAVTILAGGDGGGALDTTRAEVGTFWEGIERLVEEETLLLPLLFLLVTVVKRAFSTAG